MREDTRSYPCEGFMVDTYSDGKYVPFMRSHLAKIAGGGPCWAVIPSPTEPDMAAEFSTREEAEAYCRAYATTDEAQSRLARFHERERARKAGGDA